MPCKSATVPAAVMLYENVKILNSSPSIATVTLAARWEGAKGEAKSEDLPEGLKKCFVSGVRDNALNFY